MLKNISSFTNNVLFEAYFNDLNHDDAIQFILENYQHLQFECKDNVELVRDFLIDTLRFRKDTWELNEFLGLTVLTIHIDKYVHGSFSIHQRLKLVNIYRLILPSIDSVDLITEEYKPISLKG